MTKIKTTKPSGCIFVHAKPEKFGAKWENEKLKEGEKDEGNGKMLSLVNGKLRFSIAR